MLQNNKQIMKQITTLSTLMVNISSCIKFDRYQGYDTDDQLNAAAQELAKDRDLYASEYISGYNGRALCEKGRLIMSPRFIWTVPHASTSCNDFSYWFIFLLYTIPGLVSVLEQHQGFTRVSPACDRGYITPQQTNTHLHYFNLCSKCVFPW